MVSAAEKEILETSTALEWLVGRSELRRYVMNQSQDFRGLPHIY